jgi:Ser/Thr protein kinase RdoA (MazF antagonist)
MALEFGQEAAETAIHLSFAVEGAAILRVDDKAHGLQGSMDEADWPRLTLAEVDRVLRRYPETGGAVELLSYSPRPFSAASIVATTHGRVFVKRHHRSVRNRAGLLEEHRFIEHLRRADWGDSEPLVLDVLANHDSETVVLDGEWTYEVHELARGVDLYEQALSWTPFLCTEHAKAAGQALAKLHRAAQGYDAPARAEGQLVSSYSIFASDDPIAAMNRYLANRPLLRSYAEKRGWRLSMDAFLLPLHTQLRPWAGDLKPLWTHNDFHASNLTWSGAGEDAAVRAIVDFGLADRTNALHDLATAIERNIIEWLRMDEPGANLVHYNQLDALLAGYEESSSLNYGEACALVTILPLVHCEFALSETDYFLRVLHSEEKAYLAYEGYFLAHAEWFFGAQGKSMLDHLRQWAEAHPVKSNGRL